MSEPPRRSLISRFFNGIWSVIVWGYRLVVILFLLLLVIGFWVGRKSGPGLTVDDNVALVIAPSGELVEQIDIDPAQRFAEQFGGDPPSQTSLRDLVEALDTAATDTRIPLVVLKLDDLSGAGLAQLQELNTAIERFKARGKPVYAYAPYFEQGAYFVAAHATEISVDPFGGVGLEGLSSYQQYFKEALDKLGVTVNVFRVGEFKSAVEPFLRNDMSPEAKLANREWLGDLWTRYGQEVGTARELPADAVNRYVDGLPAGVPALRGDTAKYALDTKLVSHVETLTEFRNRVGQIVKMDDDTGSFRQIHFSQYLSATRLGRVTTAENQGQIALVVVQGAIVDGLGDYGQAGGDTIAQLLDEARRDDAVQAVVLRVNSPGGSVFASERIRRGVQALRQAGKPVVASMSSVAASGGYWISMDADRVLAHETTITGSIGIFGVVPTIEGPLGKLGVRTDGVGTNLLSGSSDLTRPMTPEAKVIVQAIIEKGYADFLTGVARGRKLEVAQVDAIARGRVWSGIKAKQLGLVDEFGNLEDATRAAAKLAKLADGEYRLQEFTPETGSTMQAIAEFFGGQLLHFQSQSAVQTLLAQLRQTRELQQISGWMNDPRGAYARCFCSVDPGF